MLESRFVDQMKPLNLESVSQKCFLFPCTFSYAFWRIMETVAARKGTKRAGKFATFPSTSAKVNTGTTKTCCDAGHPRSKTFFVLKFECFWAERCLNFPEVPAFKAIGSLGQQIWRRPMACLWKSHAHVDLKFCLHVISNGFVSRLVVPEVCVFNFACRCCPLSSLARDMMILMTNRPSWVSTVVCHAKALILIDFDRCWFFVDIFEYVQKMWNEI